MFVSTLWYLGCRFDKHNSLMTNFIFFEKFSKKHFEKLSFYEKTLQFQKSSVCFPKTIQKTCTNLSKNPENYSLSPKICIFRIIFSKILRKNTKNLHQTLVFVETRTKTPNQWITNFEFI
jgi:hypothetical protein